MRPFVFINSAMSADGKIASRERKQFRISSSLDLDRVDGLRASSDAIMVGIGTVLADNPSLTVKSEERRKLRKEKGLDENPIRVLVDSDAKASPAAEIFKKGGGKRIVAVSRSAPKDRVENLRKHAEIIVAGEKEVDLELLLEELKNRGVERLMVEGGATLNWGLVSQGLVDEIYTFIGDIIIGGAQAPTLVDGEGFTSREKACELELLSMEHVEEGALLRWRVRPKKEPL